MYRVHLGITRFSDTQRWASWLVLELVRYGSCILLLGWALPLGPAFGVRTRRQKQKQRRARGGGADSNRTTVLALSTVDECGGGQQRTGGESRVGCDESLPMRAWEQLKTQEPSTKGRYRV